MPVTTKEEQAVAKVVHQQIEGMLNQNLDLLNKIIADDAKLTHITGAVQTKDEWLNQIKSGRMKYISNHEVLFQVDVLGDSAEVISRNELEARIFGFRNTWPLQTKTKLAKRNGQWQIVASEATMY